MKLCKNCVHYRKTTIIDFIDGEKTIDLCARKGAYVDPVNGNEILNFGRKCQTERMPNIMPWQDRCSNEGKYYVEK